MKQNALAKGFKNELKWLGFVLPLILLLFLFRYYPIFQAIYGSFHRVAEIGNSYASPFVGLANYRQLFADPRFANSTFITFALMGWSLCYIPIAFIMAYAVNSLGKGKLQSGFRVAFFSPYVVPNVAIVMIFQVFLQTNGGVLNTILSMFAGRQVTIGWLSDPTLARMGVSIISNYYDLPYGIIICMAGLQTIPSELLEAAEIDGANSFQRLRRIVIPNMRGIFSFMLVTQVIWGFQRITDLLFVGMGQPTGNPGGSLQSLMMYIYQLSFFRSGGTGATSNYGVIFALTIILFAIIMVVTALNLILTGKRGDR
ncbi:MAG: sugar ABC transporter permease [Clostridia bacterium]|nr:sugar ABC transporter permease [Clostridia bacterium]